MHHAILLNKPRICEALERYRNDELNEKREKRLKEEQEKLKRQQELQAQTIAANAAAVAVAAAVQQQQQQEETVEEELVTVEREASSPNAVTPMEQSSAQTELPTPTANITTPAAATTSLNITETPNGILRFFKFYFNF